MKVESQRQLVSLLKCRSEIDIRCIYKRNLLVRGCASYRGLGGSASQLTIRVAEKRGY